MAGRLRVARLRRAALLAAGACFPLSWLLAGSVAVAVPQVHPAIVAPKTITVGDTAEAWYLSVPLPVDLCTTPLGCPQVPLTLPSVYAPDTLHVGVVLGTEMARSYVSPDLHAVPYGARILNATMTLPVDPSASDATLLPASAKIEACLATDSFEDGATGGLLKELPKIDCKTSSKLTYDPKHEVFTVDVTKFLDAWANGTTNSGIALVPDASTTTAADVWHVTLNGHLRGGGVPHIKTAITFATSPGDTGELFPTASPSPAAVVPPAPPVDLPPVGVTTEVAPPVVAPSTPVAQPVAFVTHFKYPMAFLFPIALLVLGVFLTRLFTRDATPVKR